MVFQVFNLLSELSEMLEVFPSGPITYNIHAFNIDKYNLLNFKGVLNRINLFLSISGINWPMLLKTNMELYINLEILEGVTINTLKNRK